MYNQNDSLLGWPKNIKRQTANKNIKPSDTD